MKSYFIFTAILMGSTFTARNSCAMSNCGEKFAVEWGVGLSVTDFSGPFLNSASEKLLIEAASWAENLNHSRLTYLHLIGVLHKHGHFSETLDYMKIMSELEGIPDLDKTVEGHLRLLGELLELSKSDSTISGAPTRRTRIRTLRKNLQGLYINATKKKAFLLSDELRMKTKGLSPKDLAFLLNEEFFFLHIAFDKNVFLREIAPHFPDILESELANSEDLRFISENRTRP